MKEYTKPEFEELVKKVREMVKFTVFIFGPSGAGKGYGIGNVFDEYFGGVGFITGDYCRLFEGEHASSGGLAPSEGMLEYAKYFFLSQIDKKSGPGPVRFYIDMARKEEQVFEFIEILRQIGYQGLFGAVVLHVELVETVKRLYDRAIRHGRLDDAKPEVINRRIDGWFGTPRDVVLNEHGINITLNRNEDGYVHKLIPLVEEQMDETVHLDGPCLEELRHQVQFRLPLMFGHFWG